MNIYFGSPFTMKATHDWFLELWPCDLMKHNIHYQYSSYGSFSDKVFNSVEKKSQKIYIEEISKFIHIRKVYYLQSTEQNMVPLFAISTQMFYIFIIECEKNADIKFGVQLYLIYLHQKITQKWLL